MTKAGVQLRTPAFLLSALFAFSLREKVPERADERGGLYCCRQPPQNIERIDLLPQHDTDDFPVGFLHPLTAQTTDIVDGVFNPLGDNAVAAVKLLSLLIHVEP